MPRKLSLAWFGLQFLFITVFHFFLWGFALSSAVIHSWKLFSFSQAIESYFTFKVFEAKEKNVPSSLTSPIVGRTILFYKLKFKLEFNIESSKSKGDGPDSSYPLFSAIFSIRASMVIYSFRLKRRWNAWRFSNKRFSEHWTGWWKFEGVNCGWRSRTTNGARCCVRESNLSGRGEWNLSVAGFLIGSSVVGGVSEVEVGEILVCFSGRSGATHRDGPAEVPAFLHSLHASGPAWNWSDVVWPAGREDSWPPWQYCCHYCYWVVSDWRTLPQDKCELVMDITHGPIVGTI